jgi:MFS family permease
VRGSADVQRSASTRHAWLIFAVVYLGSAAGPFNQFKVPPLIPVLLSDLHLTEVQAGLLMSVFSFSGLILALPAGWLFRRFGPRLIGTIAIASSGVGSALGALSTGPVLLLVGRLIEGIGMGLIAVFAIVSIAAWFPPHKRNLPMAIYTTWIPVGQILILTLAPPVYEAAGWRAVWWVGCVVSLLCAVLCLALVRLPQDSEVARPSASAPPFSQLFHEPGPWVLALFYVTFHIARNAFGTWTPTYLVNTAGWSLHDAANTVGIFYLVSIPFALPGGWLITRLGSRKAAYLLATAASVPAFAVAYVVDPRYLWIAAAWTAACAAIVPTAVNAATPDSVSDPSLVGPAAGVVNIGRNAGQLLAPIMIAPLVEAGAPWAWVGLVIAATLVLGLGAGLAVRERSALPTSRA